MDQITELPLPQLDAATPTPSPATLPVEIWTDGSCSGNPGRGGWAAIMRRADGEEREVCGRTPDTTNNRMELTAAMKALRSLKGNRKVIVRSDSQYLTKGMNEWLDGWQARGWRKSNGKEVENAGLWLELHEAAATHEVTWEWVRGHADDPMNERVDRLAVAARDGRRDGTRRVTGEGAAA